MTVTTRRLVRSAAGTAFVLALAVGCGAGDDQAETPAEQPQQTQQTDDTGASDGGGAAEESPAASDGGGAAAADSDLPADADLATTELPIPAEAAVQRALDFAKQDGETLVVVTADHAHSSQIVPTLDEEEPGRYPGLTRKLRTTEGSEMTMSYATSEDPESSQEHTGTQLRVAAYGPNSANVVGLTDQTDLFFTVSEALGL